MHLVFDFRASRQQLPSQYSSKHSMVVYSLWAYRCIQQGGQLGLHRHICLVLVTFLTEVFEFLHGFTILEGSKISLSNPSCGGFFGLNIFCFFFFFHLTKQNIVVESEMTLHFALVLQRGCYYECVKTLGILVLLARYRCYKYCALSRQKVL